MYPISWVAWWRRPRTWSTTSSTLPPFSTLTAIEIEIGCLCVMFFQTCSTTNVLLPTYLPCLLLAYGVGGWSLMRLVEERRKLMNSKKRELWLRKEWESWREGRVLELLRKSLVPTSSDRVPRSLLWSTWRSRWEGVGWDKIVVIWALSGEIEPMLCSLPNIQKLILFSISILVISISLSFLTTFCVQFTGVSGLAQQWCTFSSQGI